jgi:hypothetical protein
MLLSDIAIVTLPTKKLGTYALVARRLGGHDGQRQENQQVESRKSEDAMVTEAELKADDDKLSGRCPLTVRFTGSIRSTGPGTVAYTFLRSDGATGPTFTLVFKNAGTQAVFTTWTLGDSSGLPSYSGWQAIRILSPNELESNHNTGSFAISCK